MTIQNDVEIKFIFFFVFCFLDRINDNVVSTKETSKTDKKQSPA